LDLAFAGEDEENVFKAPLQTLTHDELTFIRNDMADRLKTMRWGAGLLEVLWYVDDPLKLLYELENCYVSLESSLPIR
jgi:hypothetical protein